MNDDPATSLDRLHDLALPPPVPWWPLAAGWFWLAGLVLVCWAVVALRAWRRWKQNAYRRAALAELEGARDATEVAALLRRVALAAAPRSTVASLGGDAWVEWLGQWGPSPVPGSVRPVLAGGVYSAGGAASGATELREFARAWIAGHRSPVAAGGAGTEEAG